MTDTAGYYQDLQRSLTEGHSELSTLYGADIATEANRAVAAVLLTEQLMPSDTGRKAAAKEVAHIIHGFVLARDAITAALAKAATDKAAA